MNPIRNTVKRLSTWVMACLATVALAATAQAHTPPINAPSEVGQNGPITINEVGKASPYPSLIVVSNILGTIERASVRLDGFSHGYPDDVDILLVSPEGKGVILMSDAGGQFDLSGASITFTNGATVLPDEAQIISGRTYRPTDYEPGVEFPDTVAFTLGTAAESVNLNKFFGDGPNGTWRLYVMDDSDIDGGAIGTWTLILSTTPVVAVTNRVEMNEDSSATVNVTVRDSDTDPATLVLSATSSNQTIVTNTTGFTFGGSGENRTLTITPLPNQSGTITVTLRVSDGIEATTTNITVVIAARNDAPTATISTNNLNIAQGTLSTNLQITVSDIDSDVNTITLNGRSENEAIVDNDNIYFGGTGANRTVAIAPTGAATGTTRVFIDVIDSAGASNTITLNVTVNPVAHVVAANPATIVINDNTTATPYPSIINVSGVSGLVGEVTVTLADLHHPSPDDLDVLLVHTNASGTNAVILMRGAGGNNPVSDVRLTFDQDAANPIPFGTQITTGTYRPADYLAHEGSLPAPAPTVTYTADLGRFEGMDPNGQWQLFIRDNQVGGSGMLQGGWILNIFPAPTISGVPAFVATTEDAPVSFNYTVADRDGAVTNVTVTSNDPTLFTVSKTPSNNNNPITGGTITVTPVANRFGTNTATIIVTDNTGKHTATNTFEVRITPVNDAPTMSVIPKQIVRAGSAVGPIEFSVNDVENASGSLIVTGTSSNEKLLPNSNIVIEGTGGERTVTLYPVGNQGGLVNVTLTVTDLAGASFSRTFELTVQEPGNPLFENNAAITINDNTTATPYPSTISVSNLVGTISEVRVTLFGVTHPNPDDIDILLVGPGGTPRKVVVMSDAGDSFGLTNVQLRIFDAATNTFPDNGPIVSGEYRPANYEAGDAFPTAPAGTIDATLSTFNGTNPNGDWRLYVVDDSSGARGGIIGGGWQLSIRTAPTIATIGTQETQEDEPKRVNVVIGDQQPGATNIIVTASTNNSPTANLIQSIEITGSGASRTLLVTPNPNAFGTNTITVTVTDGATSDSESFMFIVRAVTDAPVISAIADRSTTQATSTGPINFTFSDADTTRNNITLTATSSNTELVPNSNITLTRDNNTGQATISVLPAGVQTGQTEITITAADNTGQKSTETFILTVSRALAFANGGRIIINDATTATPYPSTINVQGVEGTVTDVRIALLGFTHTYPDDVDIMLVSPSGARRVMVMSDAGGPAAVSNLRLDFSQDAANPIPDSTQLTSGVWRPADYAGEFSEGTDVFPAPAPGNSTGSTFAGFDGVSPNGEWRLFVKDDTFSEAGQITEGWILILETGPVLDPIAAQTTREDTQLNVPITVRDSDTVASNLVVTATVSGNDPENLVTNITVVGTENNRTVVIMPTTNLFGTNLVTVTVSDGETTTSRSFPLTVSAVNDLPVITTATNRVVAPEDTSRTIVFNVTDVDSPTRLTNVSVVSSNPALVPNSTNNITIVSNANQNFSVTVTPAAHQSGFTDLTFTALDTNRTDSSSFTVRFEVEPVNDAPTMGGITNQTVSVIAGSSTTNINFTVGDVETPARNLVVTAFSENQALVPNSNIDIGGSAENRTIAVTTIGSQPGTARIGVVVNDGTVSRTNFFTVEATQAPGFTFANNGVITVRDNNSAQPYPSTILVGGMRGPIHSVTVTIDGLTHTAPDDIDMLLVSPTGQKVVLMSDAGGRTAVDNVRLVFAERGASLPDESQLTSGTYVATNYEGADPFAAPAPAGPYADSLSAFDGANANGTWSLYVMDDAAVHAGLVNFGWSLKIETAPSITLVTPTPVNFAEDTTGSVTVTLDDMVTPTPGLSLSFAHTNPSLIRGITTTTNGNNVTLTITPVTNATGTNTMTVTVRRSDGAQSSVNVPMNVTPVNDIQTISRLTDKTTDEEVPITFEFLVNDPDTALANLWLQATSSNQGVISNTNLLLYGSSNVIKGLPDDLVTFTLRPNNDATGSSVITVSLIDTNNNVTVSSNFTLNVTPFNDPPTITPIPTHAIPAGTSTTNIVFTVGDPEGGTLTVTAVSTDTNLVRNSDIVITPVSGAPGQRTVRVTAQPGVEGQTTITLTVTDSGGKTAKTGFVVNVRPSRERLFSNTRNVTINDNGPASEYPSTINVANLAGTVSKVTVTLNGLAHRYPDDIDMLLVSPTGQKVVLMSDAGGGVPVTNLTVRFDQTSDTQIPNDSLTSGTFRPANYETTTDTFAPPAPGTPYSANLADFNGQNPNGTWSLYMMDDTPSDAGALVGGWTLSITTEPRIVALPDLTIAEDTSGRVSFTVAEESFASTNFTFTVSSSNPAVVANNGVTVTGNGTNYTVNVTPVANASGTSTVTITMTNADGQTVTDQFVVTVTPVNDRPTITQVSDQAIPAGSSSGPIVFDYGDVETEKKNLTLTVQSSNPELIPVSNIQIVGNEMTITPVGTRTGTSQITLTVSDGNQSNSTTFLVTVTPSSTPLYANTGGIVINDNAAATPYPSTIVVSNRSGTVTKVTVTLTDVNHVYPDDVDILLVGPDGQKVILMSDAGAGGTAETRLTNARIGFDDAAAASLPDNTAITNGIYKPTNYETETFRTPAPAGPYATTLSAFVGGNPNGTWSLYVQDDASPDAGTIGTWLLSIQTTAPSISQINDVVLPEDGSTNIVFRIDDGNTAANNLTVTATTGSGRVVRAEVAGTSNNRLLTLTAIGNTTATDTVTLTVSDGTSSASTTFNVTVQGEDDAPVFTGLADASTPANSVLRMPFTVVDPEGNDVTVNAVIARQSVGTVSIEGTGTNRTLVFTPSGTFPTNSSVIVVANDGSEGTSQTIVLSVTAPTQPTISDIPTQNLREDIDGSVDFTVTAPSGNPTLSVSASNPSLFSELILGGTGQNRTLTFVLADDRSGTSTVTITATDAFGTATESFTVNVAADNDAPVITPIPDVTTTTGSTTVSVPITVSDIDTANENLTFQALPSNPGLVTGVTFTRTSTGAIANLTLATNVTGESFVTILVRDGDATSSDTFTLTVTERRADPARLAIVLSGSNVNINVTGTVGGTYVIYGSNNFQTWTPVGTVTIDSDGTSTLTLPAAGRMMFFRAQAQ